MHKATVAEILHAKDPARFGKLVAELLAMQLIRSEPLRPRRQARSRGYHRRRTRVVFSSGATRSGLRSS